MYEWFVEGAHLYIVLELYDGGRLYDKLATLKSGNYEEHAYIIAKQILGLFNYYSKLDFSYKTLSPFVIYFQNKDNTDLTIKIENPVLTKLLEESVEEDKKAVEMLVINFL